MRLRILFWAYAALIFAAYMQPLNPAVFSKNLLGHTAPLHAKVMYVSAWLAPLVPAVVGCAALLGTRQIARNIARVLAFLALAYGLFLTLASSVFSLGSNTQYVHGITLTIAVASSILIWSGSEGKTRPPRVAKAGVLISALAALWSVLTVPMVLIQAQAISEGFPYCIGRHQADSPVTTLSELRGFAFYTEKTGYKSTSEWFFHGVMLVDHPEGQKAYNWSPRRWRFDLVNEPDKLIESVGNVCVPT